jgi:hypothetical protein
VFTPENVDIEIVLGLLDSEAIVVSRYGCTDARLRDSCRLLPADNGLVQLRVRELRGSLVLIKPLLVADNL